MTQIVPVIDVMDGRVVRAVGGRREFYEPIRSKITNSTEPLVVAEALLRASGASEIYVADLDAIQGHRPHLEWIQPLVQRGVKVLVDAGVKTAVDAIPVATAGAAIVVGTETLQNFEELANLVQSWDAGRVVLSIDMQNENVIGSDDEAPAVLELGKRAGVTRFIVLELARVGTSLGPGTTELIRDLKERFPHIELIAGGGVRGSADVSALVAAGASGVLVASALHDGAIER